MTAPRTLVADSQFLQRYEGYAVPVISLNDNEVRRINAGRQVKIFRKTRDKDENGDPKPKKTRTRKSKKAQDPLGLGSIGGDTVEEDLDADLDTDNDLKVTDELLTSEVVVKALSDTPGDEAELSPVPAYKQFVPLKDILPELPAKGDFTVATIKQSLYFFS